MWNTMLKSIKKYYLFANGAGIPKAWSSTWARRYILVMGILITSLGATFFFPLTIDERYTCFFHRIFDYSHPVSDIDNGEKVHVHSEEINQSDNRNSLFADRSSNGGTEYKIKNTQYIENA